MPLTEKQIYLATLLALTLLSVMCLWMHTDSRQMKAAAGPITQAKAATLTASSSGGVLTLTGSIPDQATKTSLINAAEKVFGLSNVVDQLDIKPNLGEVHWLEQARAIFPLLKSTIRDGSFIFKEKTVEVRGEVSGEEAKTKILRSIDSAAGASITVNDQLQTPNSRGNRAKKAGPVQVKLNELVIGKLVEFDSSSSRIRKDSYRLLDTIADLLRSNPNSRIEISGHTDNTGKEEKNLRLSQRRAEAVKTYLVDKGVNAKRISAVGMGSSQPIADQSTFEGQRKNRRIEFIVQE